MGNNSRILNPTVIENGLMRQAICVEFASYIKKYCDDLGIPCAIVDGVGNVDHVWNLIKLNGQTRHVDLTNAIYIRDGYGSKSYKC